MKKLFFLSIVTVLGSISCTKNLDLNLDFETEEIVLNALFAADEPITVFVGKTAKPVGDIDLLSLIVADADVVLFVNEQAFDTLVHDNNGVYYSPKDHIAMAGYSYRLEVSAPGFRSVTTSSEKIPEKPIVDSIVTVKNAIKSTLNSDNPTLLLSWFANNLTENEYLSIKVDAITGGEDVAINVWLVNQLDEVNADCAFDYDDISIDLSCLNPSENQIDVGLETRGNLQNDSSSEIVDIEEISITLSAINRGFFEHVKSDLDLEDIELAFFEPVPTYSNIIGGRGIFATTNRHTFTIKL